MQDAWRNLSPRQRLYIELGGVIALSILLWFTLRSRIELAKDWLPNLGTEMFAFVVSIFLIDRALEEERAERRGKLRDLALASLKQGVVPLTSAVLQERQTVAFAPALEPNSPLRTLYRDWAADVRSDQYAKINPSASVDLILALSGEWASVRDRFHSTLEFDLPLLSALESCLGWIDINRDLFRYKSERVLWGQQEQIDEEYWQGYGRPHGSLADLVVGAAERIDAVLEKVEEAAHSTLTVGQEAISSHMIGTPTGYSRWQSERPPRELA
jgi:hypothetical protein